MRRRDEREAGAMKTDAYQQLEARFHRVGLLRSITGTLSWDAATIMPAGARRVRGEQLGTLGALITELISSPQTELLLEDAEANQSRLTEWQVANLWEMRREHIHSTAVPESLLDKLTQAQTQCEGIWIDAKPKDDFKNVAPAAQHVLDLTREVAKRKAEKLECGLHDALIDEWDPGLRAGDLEPLFDQLALDLPGLIDKAMKWQPDQLPALPRIDREAQIQICNDLADLLDYDHEHGRIEESAQACFMDDSPEDVRITVDIDEYDYRSAAIGITHEIGHSFYERAMPKAMRYQPVARPASAGFQESQSLLFEKIVMRTNVFAERLAGFIADRAPQASGALPSDVITSQIQYIEPGLIRVDADEATYPLHVVVRYRLEKKLIEGELEFADLPDAWSDAYHSVLGIRPPTNREGCLQDIHWYRGLYGYFQSYALGSLISAQVFEAAIRTTPSIDAELRNADVSGLRAWLGQALHSKARLLPFGELLRSVTGKSLKADAFLNHIKRRYLPASGREVAA